MSARNDTGPDALALPAQTDAVNPHFAHDLPGESGRPSPPCPTSSDLQEVDIWWSSYSPRTMTLSFLLCLLLTLAISAEAWSLGIWQERSPARYTAQGMLGLLWLVQFAHWSYLIFATNYRLTNCRLFHEVGFHRPKNREVALPQILQVVVERRLFERFLRVGRLRILIQGNTPPIVFKGVFDPEHVAMAIRKQVHLARQQST